MKKAVLILLMLVLIATIQLPAYADGIDLAISDRTPQKGDVVYVTVSLNEKAMGNSLAITFSADQSVLNWLPDESKWERKGILQDFGMMGNAGVWTTEQVQDLQGKVCTLAFRVVSDASFMDAQIECTVVVKNGAEQVGKYTAKTVISASCDHEYGAWESMGTIGHKRVCTKCGANQNQSHEWDQGVITEDPDNPYMGLKKYTCTDCGEVKTSRVDRPPEQTQPTNPTDQENDTTLPTHEHIRPTNPGNKPTLPGNISTLPENISTRPTEDSAHDHTHPTTGQQTTSEPDEQDEDSVLLMVLVFVGTLAIMAGAVTFFIVKDKKKNASK